MHLPDCPGQVTAGPNMMLSTDISLLNPWLPSLSWRDPLNRTCCDPAGRETFASRHAADCLPCCCPRLRRLAALIALIVLVSGPLMMLLASQDVARDKLLAVVLAVTVLLL